MKLLKQIDPECVACRKRRRLYHCKVCTVDFNLCLLLYLYIGMVLILSGILMVKISCLLMDCAYMDVLGKSFFVVL